MGQYKTKFENNKINRAKDTLDKRLFGEIYKELKVDSKKTNYLGKKKKGNTLNGHLTKEDIHMVYLIPYTIYIWYAYTNKHMKRCSSHMSSGKRKIKHNKTPLYCNQNEQF